jgi:hypothetical protein
VIRIVSRKFGFIRLDNEPNIFFHFKDLPEDAMGEIAVWSLPWLRTPGRKER